MSVLASPLASGLASAVGGTALGLLMPKPTVPNVPIPSPPTIVIPAQSTAPASQPANTPLAPTSMSDTAALQRARANRQISAGPAQLVLTSRAQRGDGTQMAGVSTGGGLVTRTTLLGK